MMRIVIAAPRSGSGKTTVTLGIMAALRKRGLAVAPFKVGPDFIDPGYHRLATGKASINLDAWMCGREFTRATFSLHCAGADIAIVEGVMGLFDGIDGVSEAGSSAEMAKLLDAPVVLVVDASSQSRSVAALVHGFVSFDPQLHVAGVILNNVASENHERILREALAAALPDIAVVGSIPRDAQLAIPSRHLGLVTVEENPLPVEFLDHLVQVIEQHLDLDLLLKQAAATANLQKPAAAVHPDEDTRGPCIAVARDAAFCFMYPDNLRLLAEAGAELRYFSPLQDRLPAGVSGIYLPGGYPELFAPALSANEPLKAEIREAVEAGMPIYAECGGFVYLTRGVEADGVVHPFVGIFPVQTRMLPRRKALGYREVELLASSVIAEKGTVARGHEFHYSEMEEMPPHIQRVYGVSRKGTPMGEEGFRYKNCLASYVHLHFGSSRIADSFVRHCREFKNGSLT